MRARTVRSADVHGRDARSGIIERYSTIREHYFRKGRPVGFSGNGEGNGYAEKLLSIINVEPDWTVLDMACADGGVAIPLAERAKSVTAVDFSENMLEIVRDRCREKGIDNITTIHGRWDDDWGALGIGMHDVAIETRSIRSEGLLDSALKLNRIARKKVYISMAVGDGPFDRRIYETTGRKLEMGPSYTYLYYNVLHHHMGILANISFIRESRENDWAGHEEAFEAQKWMFDNLTGEEEEKIRAYLDQHLLYLDGRWKLPYERECRWVVMSWEREKE